MKTEIAIAKAGGRDRLARVLGVATITTYHWRDRLPGKHERYLRAVRPKWFKSEQTDASQPEKPLALASSEAS